MPKTNDLPMNDLLDAALRAHADARAAQGAVDSQMDAFWAEHGDDPTSREADAAWKEITATVMGDVHERVQEAHAAIQALDGRVEALRGEIAEAHHATEQAIHAGMNRRAAALGA